IEAEALCQNRDLNIIPTGLPFDIWKLDLSVNRIKRLTVENLTLYNSIQYLDLQSNHLEFIQPGTFASLSHLEVLNLANNLLDLSKYGLGRLPYVKRLELSGNSLYTDVVEDFLKEAPLLEELSLARNSITKLSDHTFRGSPSLTHVNLQHNVIIEIESGAFQSLSNLSVLDLAMNSIPCISDFDLKQLQVLNLSKNSIEHFLMAESEEEYSLQWLDLSDNNLLYFPAFPRRNRLQHLDLSRNSVQGLSLPPSHLEGSRNLQMNMTKSSLSLHLTELVYLDLSYNEITSIPWEFFRNMNSLRFLNLSRNCLHSFVIGEANVLNSLANLDLSSNALLNLSLARGSLNLLDHLHLQDNHLQNLPSNIFRGLNRIRIISLCNNNVNICWGTHWTTDHEHGCTIFSQINTLRYLYLHNNNIKYLPPHAFHQTPLVELDLSMNPGMQVHPEALSDLEASLTNLSLKGNKLLSLGVNLSRLSNLRTLDVSENQLTELTISSRSLSLETVDLRNNQFSTLQQTSMELLNGTLCNLLLSGNPFDCCRSTGVRWLTWVNVPDRWSVLCHYQTKDGYFQAQLFSPRPSLCQEDTQDWATWSLLLLILMIVVFLTIVVALGCCLARRQKVKRMFLHHVKA
ncbi:transforming growth factor beta activator LRRC32-like, partial [Rhincodon typus]|uniref:transforming growth factor beta activator LRRC32-like n=1 Tax=Rhincodon typus TaxID=259920 RepID=UPI00202FBFDE